MPEIKVRTLRFLFSGILCMMIFLFSETHAMAQTGTSSPYSAFGIGETNNGGFSAQDGMGGTGYAMRKPGNINFSNPASYSSLQLTTFETALKSNFIRSHFSDSSQIRNSSSLGYISFGIPVSNKFGGSFGLVPMSSSGYKIFYSDSDAVIGKTNSQYESTGGVNQVYIGFAYRVSKNLSLGVNNSFLFGSIEKTSTIEYPDLSNAFYSRVVKSTSFGDYYPGFGLQFISNNLKTEPSDSVKAIDKQLMALNKLKKLTTDSLTSQRDSIRNEMDKLHAERNLIQTKKVAGNWKASLGLVFNPQMTVRTRLTERAERYRYTGGYMITEDTVNTIDQKSSIVLPPKIGLGVSLGNGENMSWGADVTYQDWSMFRSDAGSEGLRSSFQVTAGGEYIPNAEAVGNYFKRIRYRFGARYAQTHLLIKGTPIDDYGVSLGWGLPIKKAQSVVNLSADFGSRATSRYHLVKEGSVRLTLGFTLNDRWFIRKKFD